MKTNNLYPIFLKLDQIQTLIVGGGNVGLEKIHFITKQSPQAKIKVVSKKFHPAIIEFAINNSNIQLVKRAFKKNDLEGIKLLIVATNDSILNTEILTLAKAKDILSNVVDAPALCDFYTGAALKKGAVKMAISSNGVSPTLAKRLRDILDDAIPEEIDDSAQLLQKIRTKLTGNLEVKIKTLNEITKILAIDSGFPQQSNGESFAQSIHLN